LAAGIATAQPRADAAFDRLTSLAGEWRADLPGFGTMTNSIRLVSNGQAIEETIGTSADNEVSIYTRRGTHILLTHFCAMTPQGHQVRLETDAAGAPESLTFHFVDATNLPSAAAPHMRRVVTTFIDSDHFTERWTKSEGGKDTVFDLQFTRR
jgi:hypothetical protein